MTWLDDARNWTRDRLADLEAAKQQVGTTIDDAVQTADQAVDDFRDGMVDFGREHGGPVGEFVASGLSDDIGFVQGAALGAYDMGKGVVQLADGLGTLASPVEWAVNPERNLERLETAGNAVTALGNLASPTAWITQPQQNVQTASAMWNGLTAGYQESLAEGDGSEFLGRLAFDVGSMFIGVGEANAAIRGAQGANAITRVGEGARVLDPLADAGRIAGTVDDPARAAAALGRADEAVRGGDLALAGRSVDEQAEAITALSNAGRIDEARALLKPMLDSGDYPGVISRLDLSTPANGTYFWSGNAQEAQRVAESFGGRTLESTPGGRIVDGWSDIPGWQNGGNAFWSEASRSFASGATGDVTVVVTRDKATTMGGDVWRNVEGPVIAQLREAGIVGDVRVMVIDPLNPSRLVPLTGIAADRALEAEDLLPDPPR